MKNRTYKMVLVSLFAALTAIGAFMNIKLPPPLAPFTLQIFFVLFSALILGPKLAFASQIIYIAVGLAGAPVFSTGGGFQYIFTPTFGFILGFACLALVTGYLAEKQLFAALPLVGLFAASVAGILVCYVVGIPYLYSIVKFVNGKDVSAAGLIWKFAVMYLPLDLVKAFLASLLALEIKKRIKVL